MLDDLKNHHAEWLTLPFGDNLQLTLKTRYKVAGIPTLVVLKADGALICANGRPDVQTKGSQAFKDWLTCI
ncbi:nucleoredoxin-like protein 2 [Amblyomma americanum]